MKRLAGVKIRMIPCLARCYRMAAHRSGPVCGGQDVTVDENRLAAAHELYLREGLGARNDAIAMQYLVKDWSCNPKRPALVR